MDFMYFPFFSLAGSFDQEVQKPEGKSGGTGCTMKFFRQTGAYAGGELTS